MPMTRKSRTKRANCSTFIPLQIFSLIILVSGCAELDLDAEADSGLKKHVSISPDDSSDSHTEDSESEDSTDTSEAADDSETEDGSRDTVSSHTPEGTDTNTGQEPKPDTDDTAQDDDSETTPSTQEKDSSLPTSTDQHATDSDDEIDKPVGTDSSSLTVVLGMQCAFETAVKLCGSVDQCVDGVCCDTPCDRPCESCNIEGHEGTCTAFPPNIDPENDCGVCQVCDGDTSHPGCGPVGYGEDIKGDCDACRFCNGSETTPDCTPVPPNQDPFDDCDEEADTPCGRSGFCNGLGLCALASLGTECEPTSCSDNQAQAMQFDYLCDGRGNCSAASRICGGYRCDSASDRCGRWCDSDADCMEGYTCNAGRCDIDIPKADGAPCLNDWECDSRYCSDGVCCGERCNEACFSCNQPDRIEDCTPVPANTDPKNDCPACFVCGGSQVCTLVPRGEDYADDCVEDTQPNGCGPDGTCDGRGGCAFFGADRICGETRCDTSPGHDEQTLYTCDGRGNCDARTRTCGAYRCADDATCDTTCNKDEGCSEDSVCADGVCLLDQPDGSACRLNSDCKSSICVDEVCCDSACDGICERCDIAGRLGTCAIIDNHTDPDDECPACEVCVDGQCTAVAAGSDPADDCSASLPNECGYSGDCDGYGACEIRGESEQCGVACDGDVLTPLFCDGEAIGRAGCRTAGDEEQCPDNLICDPVLMGCPSACLSTADCLEDSYCDAELAQCLPRKDDGETCKTGSECLSAHCVDGVCCDTPCGDDCFACDIPGHEGACTPHDAGGDPDDECPVCWGCDAAHECAPLDDEIAPAGDCTNGSTCGHTGQCIKGACEYFALGLTCKEMVCDGPSGTPAVTRFQCDGQGECKELVDQNCGGYRCASKSACLTQCETTDDCAASFSCNDGVCTSDNPDGTPCILDSECMSGLCIDNHCCNSPCDGECEACDIDGFEGLCVPEPNGEWGTHLADDAPDCGTCEVCDGDGACRPVDPGLHPKDNADPKNLCGDAAPPESCGFTGSCEPDTGSCAFYSTEQPCAESCPSPGAEVFLWHCDGDGECVIDETGTPCPDSLTCRENETDCRDVCRNQSHCEGESYCEDGVCLPKKTGGETCGAAFECLSGYCPSEDGVCCDSPCDETCESCGQENLIGVCLPIPAGEDPDGECDDGKFCTLNDFCGSGQTCEHDGSPCDEADDNDCNDCNELSDSCIQPPGTQCGDTIDSLCSAPDTCDDKGVCMPNHTKDKTPCAEDSDDCTYDYCLDGICAHPDSGNSDTDTFCDAIDNCPQIPNQGQEDSDMDNVGDACDECPTDPNRIVGPCVKSEMNVYRYNNIIEIMFSIANHGATPVNLANLTMRYWYTIDHPFDHQQLDCYWAASSFPAQCNNIRLSPESDVFHPVNRPKANYYMEVKFIGTLNPIPPSSGGSPGKSGNFKIAWNTIPYADFNSALDYSYDNFTAMTETNKVTLYENGVLIWGIEP